MMNISDIRKQRNQERFQDQYDETAKVEKGLRRIIAFLQAALDGRALDWQERDRIMRAIGILRTTQQVLMANLFRHADARHAVPTD